jgi:hypothetical protein
VPSWGTILKEIQQSAAQRGQLGPDIDGIRLKYIQRLRDHSKRAVIVYASGWLRSGGREDLDYSVEGNDVHALMEVCHDVGERELDLVIHSPGGSPQAAEQMVNYLRTQFDYIRALVPLQAKSAATMIALGCDEIVMGRHSELGPIDPQILVPVPGGARFAPAHAILRDFDRAKREIAEDVNSLAAWTPILHAYAGGLLEFCTQQIKLSQEIVAGWLKQHMLRHDDVGIEPGERDEVANRIADYFGSEASYDRFRTHGRPIRLEELEAIRGLRVRRLEADDGLQDALLSIYHVLDFTFGGPAVKVVENHLGARYVRIHQQVLLPAGPPAPGPGAAPAPLPGPAAAPSSELKRPRRRQGARKSKKRH